MTPPRAEADLREALTAVSQYGSIKLAAASLGLPRTTMSDRYHEAKARGLLRYAPHVNTAPVIEECADQPQDRRVEKWLSAAPRPMSFVEGPRYEFATQADGTFVFGACGDQHMGSKYERLDVNEALYDRYVEAECTAVFNTGNYIDGDASFNVHDVHTHGLTPQARYLAANYPSRHGVTTYAVTGADHEGWYAKREGVDVGGHVEQQFRIAGRTDWVDLGYMEAPVFIYHPATGNGSILSVVHPGGGSAYAISYSIQKIIESLDGGEKPAIGLYGHYHKLWAGNIRNVWVLQTGCGQDQTPFMRQKKLEAHVGGALVTIKINPESGAVTRFQPEMIRFFNRGFYSNRWSPSGPVSKTQRSIIA